ncbi:hypothetical protein [Streptomyces sp. NPDC055400]
MRSLGAVEGLAGEVAVGGLQASATDPRGDGGAFVSEEAMRSVGGDVVRGGDRARVELGVMPVSCRSNMIGVSSKSRASDG